MISKTAAAIVSEIRQQTQFTCCAASITACLKFFEKDLTEKDVNRVLQARPKRGARWEEIMGCLQYFGMRGTLKIPCDLDRLKRWTDKGCPAIIGWTPHGRDWAHASVVCDVDPDKGVLVMDPNSANTKRTLRWWSYDDFSDKWYEGNGKDGNILVRRPACKVDMEVSGSGVLI